MRKLLVLFGLIPSFVVGAEVSCEPVKIQDLYRVSDLVFSGEVVDSKFTGEVHPQAGVGKEVETTFKVVGIWKGIQLSVRRVKHFGELLPKGKLYLVYANEDYKGGFVVPPCGRMVSLSDTAEDMLFLVPIPTLSPIRVLPGKK